MAGRDDHNAVGEVRPRAIAASGIVAMLIGKKNKVAGAVGLALSGLTPKLEDAIKSARAKLEAADAAAATKQQNLAATLDGFRKDLDAGERRRSWLGAG